MKSYLSLIPISAKVHQRQNRMTILCIIISILLVTAVFSVADMFLQAENLSMKAKHGNWHLQLNSISQETAEKIGNRSDVVVVGQSEQYNTDAGEDYYIGESKTALYGVDEAYLTQIFSAIEEGSYPTNEQEVILSPNAKLAMDIQIGDTLTLRTPAREIEVIISGFGTDDTDLYQGQTYLVAVYMTSEAYRAIMDANGKDAQPSYYVQFQTAAKASAARSDLQQEYQINSDSIVENIAVMGLAGQSDSGEASNIYGLAGILFVFVLLAGVLMISGSLNSNVAQRTKFFGMLRCIGASRQQIIRFVRLESLNWCKTAVPIGLLLGTVISWSICAWLRYGIVGVGGEFSEMPVFKLSIPGLLLGCLVGIGTVLLAAETPAKRAAKVPPMAAVSGNVYSSNIPKWTKKTFYGRIERILGVQHATQSPKNWMLMTGSFAFSITLFLCISVGLDFAKALLPSMSAWQPDLTLNGYANERIIDTDLKDEISAIPEVKSVYSCSYQDSVPAVSSRQVIDHVNLLSYDDILMDYAKGSVVTGNIEDLYGDSNKVMTVYSSDNPLKVGDTLQINGETLEITCSVSQSLYSSECLVICSQETYERLTGEQDYTQIGIQLNADADDETIRAINALAVGDVIFTDLRESNSSTNTTYYAVQSIAYGFLAILALITLAYIVNSISMSVSARIKQYGAMWAVGMDGGQLTRMIEAEAFTYAVSGLAVGFGIGIPTSRFIYLRLVTHYFGQMWKLPVSMIVIASIFVIVSAMLAVYAPAKRIRNMPITETINEL